MGNRRNIESQNPAAPDADPELDALFAQARNHLPSDETLLRMLRAVPSSRRGAARRLLKPLAAALSAAAVIVAAVLIYLPPGQPRAFAFAEVAREMRRVPVVKYTSRNGDVGFCGRGRYAAIRDDGRQIWFWDQSARVKATFDAERGTVILCSADPWPPLGDGGASFLTLDSLIQDAEALGRSLEDEWKCEETTEAGRPLLILHPKDPARRRRIFSCAIDLQSRRFAWAERPSGRMAYEYPSDPPMDIYDVGAPRDAPVVDWRAGPEILELRGRVITAAQTMDRNYEPYRLVEINTRPSTYEVKVTIADGERYRMDCYGLPGKSDWTIAELAALAGRYAVADEPATALHTIVCDGHDATLFYRGVGGKPQQRVAVRDTGMYKHPLTWFTWWRCADVFFGVSYNKRFEWLASEEHGWLGYRAYQQPDEFWRPQVEEVRFDPQHGHLPCLSTTTEDPDADWVVQPNWQEKYIADVVRRKQGIICPLPNARPERGVIEVLAWAEVRPGQWYPQTTQTRTFVLTDDGVWQEGTQDRFERGEVVFDKVTVKPNPQDSRVLGTNRTYRYALVTPIEQVDETWFQVPAEWLDVPAEPN